MSELSWPKPKEVCWDVWQWTKSSQTFPQKQVGQVWDTTFGKVLTVFGLSNVMEDFPLLNELLGPVNALTQYLIAQAEYLRFLMNG